ncbi:MAG: glycerol kinase GlpK, partial [Erysipelotrichaceae bacterium]|nr:glycerol kinase GlpK [Erysipelotrichaceae bacterium]
QSTQGTKAILFDKQGNLVERFDAAHKQMINNLGWVSHDLNEIYANVIKVARRVLENADVLPEEVACIGITNQRETSCAFDKAGNPLAHAIVWQCARARDITADITEEQLVKDRTGLNLSPYFPAAKYAWFLRNEESVKRAYQKGELHLSTIDTYLLYRLTEGRVYATDYSNASRTQLFNIHTLQWDEEICNLFGIDVNILPEVKDSGYEYGMTTFEGLFPEEVPVCSLVGDSQGALFGQRCINPGMVKATYGTGSSVMMNVGTEWNDSDESLVTSLAWGRNNEVTYCLEGNINYSGAVITWLKNDLQLIESAKETSALAESANPQDETYLVPAFSGLGAPYWRNEPNAMLVGMSRTTTKNEVVKAALDSIAYQIHDILSLMNSHKVVNCLCVDGGPTGNPYLMQFQSDIAGIPVMVSGCEESSALGAALLAGLQCGFYEESVMENTSRKGVYLPKMDDITKQKKVNGWNHAVSLFMNDK